MPQHVHINSAQTLKVKVISTTWSASRSWFELQNSSNCAVLELKGFPVLGSSCVYRNVAPHVTPRCPAQALLPSSGGVNRNLPGFELIFQVSLCPEKSQPGKSQFLVDKITEGASASLDIGFPWRRSAQLNTLGRMWPSTSLDCPLPSSQHP